MSLCVDERSTSCELCPSPPMIVVAGNADRAMPDLAATLQALAMSGPDSSRSRSDGGGAAPDVEATLRSAAVAVAASASGNATGDAAEGDELLKECVGEQQVAVCHQGG